MKTCTCSAVVLLACTLTACGDDVASPVAPSVSAALHEPDAPSGPGPVGSSIGPAPSDSGLSSADGSTLSSDPGLEALRAEVDRILEAASVLEPAASPVRYVPALPLLAPLHQVPAWFDWRHYAESVHACLDLEGRCAPRSRVLNRPEHQDLVVFPRDIAGVCHNVGFSSIIDASSRSIPWVRIMFDEIPRIHNQFTGTRWSGSRITTTSPSTAEAWLRAPGSTVVVAHRDRRRFGTRTIAYQPVAKVGVAGIDTPALLLYTGVHGDGHDT